MRRTRAVVPFCGIPRRSVLCAVVTCALMWSLGAGGALADESLSSLEAKLADANARYEELSMQVAMAGEALNDTYYQLETTTADIEDTTHKIGDAEQRLKEAQDVLAARVSANYRSGSMSLIDMIMGCSSVEDFVSAVYYADKVAAQDAASIQTVQDTRVELDNHRADLEELKISQEALVAQEEEQVAALQETVDAQEAYIAGLDEQVRQKLEEQRAAELAAQQAAAAEEAARQQAAADAAAAEEARQTQAAPQKNDTATKDQTNDSAQQEQRQQTQTSQETSKQPANTSSSSTADTASNTTAKADTTSSKASGARATILAAAYSQIGVPYVFGAYSPGSALDCSGFTKYCYAQAGYTLPHSSVAQAAMAKKCSLSELQPGDLIFWVGTASGSGSGSHVAIYLGNGQVIHANGTRVATGPLSSTWTSCGSIV